MTEMELGDAVPAARRRLAARPNMLNPSRNVRTVNSRYANRPMLTPSNTHPEKQSSSEQPGDFCITYLKSKPVGAL